MTSRGPSEKLPKPAKRPIRDSEFARRIDLAREVEAEPAPRPRLRRLLGELQHLAEPVRRPFRQIPVETSDTREIVLILPGFGTSHIRMRYMARHIERAGHKAKRWGLGWNLGPNSSTLDDLAVRLDEVCARYDRKVVLLGWSLGGVYARELAKMRPDCVKKVITMGTPFSGSPRANNVWRVYQFVTGHRVDQPPVEADLSVKPPVETVAMWSPNDGMIAPRSAAGFPGERDRAIALRCTHIGFSYSPEAIQTVLSELSGH